MLIFSADFISEQNPSHLKNWPFLSENTVFWSWKTLEFVFVGCGKSRETVLTSLYEPWTVVCVAYHCKCIDPWLTEKRNTCPLCKEVVGRHHGNTAAAAGETQPLLQAQDDADHAGYTNAGKTSFCYYTTRLLLYENHVIKLHLMVMCKTNYILKDIFAYILPIFCV